MRTKIEDLGKVSVTVEEEDYNKSKFYYENTIVVDSSLGMCCISIRPVPAGIPLTDTRFWKCITKLETSIMIHYRRLMDEMEDIRQLLKSSSCSGTAFSNKLGSDTNIGISQRKISDLFFELDKRLSNLEGSNGHALFKLNVTPNRIVSDCPVEVTVTCNSCNLCNECCNTFDKVKIYFNNKLKFDNENVVNLNYTDFVEETTNVRVEAVICGRYYADTKTVLVNYPLIISSGETVNDALNSKNINIVPYNCNFGGKYNVNCDEEKYIFIIANKQTSKKIKDIKINKDDLSFEDFSYNKLEYCKYDIYKSTESYSAGYYTVIINN